ncbi:PREDICTED: LOW QUALITY PROTEIN: sushi, von Willebrand factor type A, EGF and pentraxin domain-containing protein 1-like [Branchiostoma belcheri]|uniref:LOW QUALITY PROTEIN: sushi, von Willebrand factor type A, EGF and pentraxin domain-containing protein 1-like n=1 Tax=Branchiostoma belcheri TaxID=7741 RepID=A0A6P4YJF9_BRABE|nr:PREDICTED: LOW QUALITY PROTEIN: sushi, von Willebrand factor type A, EGF and pentraxin domain-containing protein 1-like [Branchiostoma belcheri]
MAAYLALKRMLFACVFFLNVFHRNAVVAQTATDVADDLNTNLLTPYLSTPGEKVDLVFVVDHSAFSQDKVSRGFLFMVNFVKEILSGFTVDSAHTRVSLITFNTEASVRINDLGSRDETKCTVFSTLDEVREEVPLHRGLTATTDALRRAKEVLMESRSDAKKAVILITDSYSTIGVPPAVGSAEIRSLRWAGWDVDSQGPQLEVFTVGVNGADEAELESVASSSPTNVFNIDNFSTLRQVSKLIHKVPENSSWEVTGRQYCGQCDTSASCACDTGLGQYHCVCDPGYHGDGITCQACPVDTYKDSVGPGTCTACPGTTSSPRGTTSVESCTEVLCPVLPPVPHATSFHIYSPANEAQVNTFTTCKNTPGDFCYFQCDEGFFTSDPTRLYCDGDSWDHGTPTCEVVECESITETAGMTVAYAPSIYGDYTYGTVATITCDEGYRTYGSMERTCTADGTWNGTVTQCQPTECPSLVPPAYGQIYPATCSSEKPEYQTVCTYSCGDGFLLVGPANRTCQSNDQWTDSGVAITCNDTQPPSIVCPSGRTLYSDDGNKKTFHWNSDEPVISDNSGFYNSYTVVPAYSNPYDFLVGIHTLTYKVTDAAGNEASCERRLIVEASQPPSLQFCPNTTTITVTTTTGTLDWSDPVYLDADNNTVTTECDRNKGESASLGTHNIHCNAQGYRAVNLCSFQVILKAPDCNIPADPLHGSSSCTATSTHQERCTLSCDAGYAFASPESQYLCSYSGVWTPEPNWQNCAGEERKGITTQTNTIQYDLSADTCDETVQEEISSSFNKSFFELDFVQTQCANHNCSLPNINVTCETARRRRDVAQNSPTSERRQLKRSAHSRKSSLQEEADLNDIESGRKKRATNFVVTIVFIIRVEVSTGGSVSSSDQSDLFDIQDEIYYGLDDIVADGSFDITIVIAGVTITCDVQTSSYVAEDPELDTTCENGQVSRQPSQYEAYCVNCAVGTYKSGDSCEQCPHGQYQHQEAQQQCLPCPEGTNTTRMGAINITECRKLCSPGNYSSTGLEDCTPCEVGSYQPNERSTSCEQCSNGTSTEAVGSTSEDDCKVVCPAGSSSPTGVVPCSICAEDTYQTDTGQRECVACPDGYETDASGATSQSDCKAHQLYILTITLVITYNLDLETYNENFKEMFEATGLPGEMTVTEIDTDVTSRSARSSSSTLTTCTADHAVSPNEARPNLGTLEQALLDQLGTGMMGTVPASPDNFTIVEKDPCRPDPCINGMCQEDPVRGTGYECVCTVGFAGTDCETDIDDCAQNPCLHSSTCQDGINMFTCHCAPGYTGPNCEIDIDDCSPSPCENGGSCTDLVNEYTCYCMTGYTGTDCSVNTDDCASSPCEHGTCHDLVADYSCTCAAGYSGKDCDIDIDECQSQPCQNGGDCTDLVNAYTCSCAPGFEGVNCETDIDECASNPCDNGGICEDEQNGYKCLCAVGFIGTNCEQNPSPNFDFVMDGSSTNYAAAGNIPDLSALTMSFWMKTSDQMFGTPVSYVMDTWETPHDNLLTLTDYGSFDLYVNGEVAYTMVAANVGEWTHVCVTWQSSDGSWQVFLNGTLENSGTNLATGQVIQGGGTFVLGQENNPSVSTPDERMAFTGQLSRVNVYSTVLSAADINTLAQGCSNDLGTLRGWTDFLSRVGTTAVQNSPSQCQDFDECEEEDICSSYGIHVQCVNTVGDYNCTCAPGYTGETCQRQINLCDSLPCQNGAPCKPLVNDYSCSCIDGWGGKDCSEVANSCESNPCKNGGTCRSYSDGYSCTCTSNLFDSDRNCERICADSICENGGTCDSSDGSCTCSQRFEGTNCQLHKYNPCTENPCLNNGTCNIMDTDGYDCDCAGNIDTDNCEEPDVCSSDPCQNDGICARNGTQRDTYICGCKTGTEGDRCERITDFCAPNPCQNNARCVNKIFEGFDCICPNGFTGTHCDSEIVVCTANLEQNLCQNGGTARENGTTCACDCPEDNFVCAEEGLYGGFTPTCECSKCYGGDDDEDLYCSPGAGQCVVTEEGQPACQCERGYSGKHCQIADHQEEFCTYVTINDMHYKNIQDWRDTIKDNLGSNVANKTRDAYTATGNGYVYESWRINSSYNNIREGSGGKVLVELIMTFTIPPEHGGEYDIPELKEVGTSRNDLRGFNVSVDMYHRSCPGEDDLLVVFIAAGCVGGFVVISLGVLLAWCLKKKKAGPYSRPTSGSTSSRRVGPSPEPIYEDIDSSLPGYQNQAYIERQQSLRMAAWLSHINSDAPPQYENDDQSERPSTSMSGRPIYDNESQGGSSVDIKSGIHPTSDVFTVLSPGARSMDPVRTNRLYPILRDSATPSDVRIPMKQFFPD